MGKYLQIQVRAWTYDEEELLRAWPCLTSLAWSEYDARNAPSSKHGVMELAENLPDILRFGELLSFWRKLKVGHFRVISRENQPDSSGLTWPLQPSGYKLRASFAKSAPTWKGASFTARRWTPAWRRYW